MHTGHKAHEGMCKVQEVSIEGAGGEACCDVVSIDEVWNLCQVSIGEEDQPPPLVDEDAEEEVAGRSQLMHSEKYYRMDTKKLESAGRWEKMGRVSKEREEFRGKEEKVKARGKEAFQGKGSKEKGRAKEIGEDHALMARVMKDIAILVGR